MARSDHSLGDATDFLPQLLFLHGSEVGTIHLHSLGVRQMPPEDAIDQILEVVQAVALMTNDRLTLRRMDLQAESLMGFLKLDRRRKPEMPEHRIENLNR
jgi:hypothetical protein